MDQKVNVLASKPDNLSSIPRTHLVELTCSCFLSSDSTSLPWEEHIYKLIHANK